MGNSVTCCFHSRIFSSSNVPHAPLLEDLPSDEHIGLDANYGEKPNARVQETTVADRRFPAKEAAYRAPPSQPAPTKLDPPKRTHPRDRPPDPTLTTKAESQEAEYQVDPFASSFADQATEQNAGLFPGVVDDLTDFPMREEQASDPNPISLPVGDSSAATSDQADPPSISDSEASPISEISDLEPVRPGPVDENKMEDFDLPSGPPAEDEKDEHQEVERSNANQHQRRDSSQITTQTQILKVTGAGGKHVDGTYRWFATHARFVMFSDNGGQFQIRGGVDLSEYGDSFESCWVLEEITEAETVKLYAVEANNTENAENNAEEVTIPSTGWISIDGPRPAPIVKSDCGGNGGDVSDFDHTILTVGVGDLGDFEQETVKQDPVSVADPLAVLS